MSRSLLIVICLLVLNGCATSYKPKGYGGGFSETQLDTNVFRVSFSGNGYTSPEQAEEMALLRSAEVALDHGFKYFVIVTDNSRETNSSFTTQGNATTTFTGNGTANTTFHPGQTLHVSMPTNNKLIMCFVDKPKADVFAYSAQFLVDSLSKKYLK
jgi:hypothetical protein